MIFRCEDGMETVEITENTVNPGELKVGPQDFELLKVLGKGGYGKVSHTNCTPLKAFFYSCLIITNVVKITSSLIRKHKRLGKILVSSWKLSIRIQRCWSSICWGLGLLCRVVDLYSKCVLCCLAISHRGSWTYWFLCAWEGMIWAVCVVDWKTTRAEFQWE